MLMNSQSLKLSPSHTDKNIAGALSVDREEEFGKVITEKCDKYKEQPEILDLITRVRLLWSP